LGFERRLRVERLSDVQKHGARGCIDDDTTPRQGADARTK
jgi:hypothetical protein